ncbi:alpha/beta hydrolase [Williamsia serinedens]|uniref:Diacylglycerol O-acyltransferase / trehalose O-mycolyltransferase n=1 Tax=Williamsia serinedens TaxID=391736 RepID=A0ABT1H1X9_9NOCA|nr:alpha/beta hydrolase family protein [Williamsia serinedens]MCP2161241.1 diacylglycerol O-acyltransferase / trehalose O-mycolyltransferase [Williamsia serinedens]
MPSAVPGSPQWTVLESPTGPRTRVLRALAVAAVLALGVFVGTAYFSNQNSAQALVGHPEVLRPGCTWDKSGNFVQNCWVWSPSQNKNVMVQIRASNDSTRGVYLLDGMRASDARSAWTTDVQASKIYDGSTNTTLVMPVGGASSFYTDWNGGAGANNVPIKQETFLTSELPAYLQQQFGVAPNNNAIVGLSMSAGPAVTLAAKHPEQFKVVQAMSGYYQIDNPLGALGVFATQTMVSNYTNGIVNMWGPPGSAQWAANDPSKNLAKLKENGQVLVVSSGNAFLSPQEMASMAPQDRISAILLEALSAVSTVLFQLQAAQQGVSVVSLPNYGGHDWANWQRGLTSGRDTVMNALRSSPPVTQKTTVLPAAQIGAPSSSASSSSATSSSAPVSTSSTADSTAPTTTTTVPGSVAVSAPASASESAASESSAPASGDASQSADPSDSSVVTTTTTPAP